MKTKKHHWILYLISVTILITIVVQLYWNYKNYQQNKQRIINEIQLSLDNAIEQYYAQLSKKNFLTIVKPKDTTKTFNITSIEFNTNENKDLKQTADSLLLWSKNITDKLGKKTEKIKITQLSKTKKAGIHLENRKVSKVKVFRGKKAADSLRIIKGLSTILIAMRNDSLDYKKADSILKKEFKEKKIAVKHYFKHLKKDTLFYTNKTTDFPLMATAKSTFLKPKEKVQLFYEKPTKEALQRSSVGILLSLLLSLAIIASLFYLLNIINKQKQLAEIKNDLISNITHEFKTPITTIATAIEAINSFDAIESKEKTKNYLSISSMQLKKLQLMVEKLLETATLDSKKLLLKKEDVNLVSLLQKLINKHTFISSEKHISFITDKEKIVLSVDKFHLENAISNIIDNAIKYGGNLITVCISSEEKKITIEISDNGKGIEQQQLEKIFDKFYRIPKGNTHNVKGFGIGLYYTKKIIEKHQGTITAFSNKTKTSFKIKLANV